VRYEQRAADLDKRAANKQQSLSTAQRNVDRAVADERRKQEREAARRRDEDLRRVRELENVQRATQGLTPPQSRVAGPFAPQVQYVANSPSSTVNEFAYDVCLSFAGEERTYVEMVAGGLKARGLRVFYDADEEIELWGKDLVEHFDHIYRVASRYCVMFVSDAYARKPWTRHERRSALARAIEKDAEYILPARFDDTELDGMRPTVKWLDLRAIAPETLTAFIVEKVNSSSA